MENKISYVKQVIRSVLTSSKNSITISELLKDYKLLEGDDLPYSQLGFRTIYEALAAMDDVLQVSLFNVKELS